MLNLNEIPWTQAELIDYGALVLATLMVAAFPVFYVFTADLRDRLAQVIAFATGATATAFVVTAVLWPLEHAGVILPAPVGHWLARVLYLAVGTGKLVLLFALIRERRRRERSNS